MRMRKTVLNRVLACMLALAVCMAGITVESKQAKAAETYPYAYTIQNFLTDYQYIVSNDLKVTNHTVGSVVVGGSAELCSFGEGMAMPAYINHYVKSLDIPQTKWPEMPSSCGSNKVYYETMEPDAHPGYLPAENFIQGKYVDTTAAFSQLITQSAQMAASGTVPTKTGNVITVDFSSTRNVVIPASLLDPSGYVAVNIVGVDSVEEFVNKDYTISFTGIGSRSVHLENDWWASTPADYNIFLKFNDQSFGRALKTLGMGTNDNQSGSQFVNTGMKLVLNLPDAIGDLSVIALSGHLVAPQASVKIAGGGYEGGIIARNVTSGAEAHFYPYYKLGTPRDGSTPLPTATPANVPTAKPQPTLAPGVSPSPKEIVETDLDKKVVVVGNPIDVKVIKDKDGKDVPVNQDNADFQWQKYDEEIGNWVDIPGANTPSFTPGADLEGEKIRCEVTGKGEYTGTAYDESIVKALPPVQEKSTDTTITVTAKDNFEYRICDKDGTPISDWVKDNGNGDKDNTPGTITFDGLTPATDYTLEKQKVDTPETLSDKTPASTIYQVINVDLKAEVVNVGGEIEIKRVDDQKNNPIEINDQNATYKWQEYDPETKTWKDIPGANTPKLPAKDELEGKHVQCVVTGTGNYVGTVTAEAVVRCDVPVEVPGKKTPTTITIEAENGFEYQIQDKNGTPISAWTNDGEAADKDKTPGNITFDKLQPNTDYVVVKRANDDAKTESDKQTVRTADSNGKLVLVEAALKEDIISCGTDAVLAVVKDNNGANVPLNGNNATYQWQSYDPATNTWKNVAGATKITVPTNDLEGKKIRCEVTGINNYTGVVYAEGQVKAKPPVVDEDKVTDSSITVKSETGYEYQIQDKDGTPISSWVKDGDPADRDKTPGTITFTDLKEDTEYKLVKRVVDEPKTESTVTLSSTDTSDGQVIKKGSVELNIPTIVMKKIMGHKMKFQIKLLNFKGGKVRCSSSNKKIATINKKGLVKSKKKSGKCKLVINVTKGKHKIQYIVNLVVRKSCKKNYSLYKYKTNYKYPSVSLYKLIPMGKSYKIKLKHLSKKARVTYKTHNKKVATVNKKGKVRPRKNGRANVDVTIKQNGVTYKYFVVVRVTKKGVESNTSYLKVIK